MGTASTGPSRRRRHRPPDADRRRRTNTFAPAAAAVAAAAAARPAAAARLSSRRPFQDTKRGKRPPDGKKTCGRTRWPPDHQALRRTYQRRRGEPKPGLVASAELHRLPLGSTATQLGNLSCVLAGTAGGMLDHDEGNINLGHYYLSDDMWAHQGRAGGPPSTILSLWRN